jgi:hypothetical protein
MKPLYIVCACEISDKLAVTAVAGVVVAVAAVVEQL